MIKLIFLYMTIFALSYSANASEEILNRCELEGNEFANGKGSDSLSPDCYNQILISAGINANKVSKDGLVQVFGHRNIIFIYSYGI